MPTKDRSIIRFMETTPWAITRDHLDVLFSVVSNHLDGITCNVKSCCDDSDDSDLCYITPDSIAVINISGTIVKKFYGLEAISGGYTTDDYIECIQECLENTSISGIILNIDSPGGSVTGTKELSDFIYSSRGIKPIITFASGQMCSAAYWIGSAADKIIAFNTATIGSIGVILRHQDWSKAEETAGLKTTYIYAGKYKKSGNSSEPLGEDDLAYIQSSIDDYYTIFIEDVARNLNISIEDALKLGDARTHIASKAKALGLVHEVGNLTYATYVAKKHRGEKQMAIDEKEFAAMQDQLKAITEASARQSEALAAITAERDAAQAKLDATIAAVAKKEKMDAISAKLASCKITDATLVDAVASIDEATATVIIGAFEALSGRLSVVAEELSTETSGAHSQEIDSKTPATVDAAVEQILAEGKITDIDEAIAAASTLFPKLFVK